MSETSDPHRDAPAATAPDATPEKATTPGAAASVRKAGNVSMHWDEVFWDELCGLVSSAHADQRAQRRPDHQLERADEIDGATVAAAQALRGNLLGLAFSGGGIRSASFALGVLQALIRFGVAERFHYLSTVSGGGYLGVCLAWLRKRYGDAWKRQLFRVVSGARAAPTTHRRHGQSDSALPQAAAAAPDAARVTESSDSVWLDYIRQHGNFLQPPGMGTLALAGVALRNSTMSAGIYLLIAALLLAFGIESGVIASGETLKIGASCRIVDLGALHPRLCWDAPALALTVIMAIAMLFIGYSLGSFILSFERHARLAWSVGAAAAFAALSWVTLTVTPTHALAGTLLSALTLPALAAVALGVWLVADAARAALPRRTEATHRPQGHGYAMRLAFQRATGTLTALLIVFAVLAALPWTYHQLGAIKSGSLAALAAAGAAYQAFWARSRYLPSSIVTHVRLMATAGLVFAAAALLAYRLAWLFAVEMNMGIAALAGVALATLIVAFCTNLNQFGLGRMYRDRLMETFMPNLAGIDQTQWQMATDADGQNDGLLQKLWPPVGEHRLKLYPLINANVVLVDSKVDTYRGRAGDSFVLSPASCGSDATDWAETRHFADNELAAATAMAASGAAANPNAGPGGRGITRNRIVSFLMFLMQARLGIWVRNPHLDDARVGARVRKWLLGQRPNFLFPGIRSGLFGRGLSEKSYFLELTDGGHFDNTGVYELVRRRARLIVLAQAGQDGTGGMADLANLTEKIRVDFGVHLRFDDGIGLGEIVPPRAAHGTERPCAIRGHAVARILYPATRNEEEALGWLVYLQATPVRNLPVDVQSYWHHNPAFPHQTTGDQFFDEAQLEAYRELGYAIAKRFFTDVVRAQPIDGDLRPPQFEAGQALPDVFRLLRPVPAADMTLDPPDEPEARQTTGVSTSTTDL